MHYRQRAVCLALLCLSTVASAQIWSDTDKTPGKLLAEFKVATDGRPLCLPVTFKGKVYTFLVDTGTPYSTFDTSLESLLGEPRQTFEVKHPKTQKLYKSHIYYGPDATIGSQPMQRGGPVACVDLAEVREAIGIDIRGIVGMGFFRRYVLQVDFEKGKLRLRESDIAKHPDWGEAVALGTISPGLPVVMSKFADYSVPFVVDLGYRGAGQLSQKAFTTLVEKKAILPAAARLDRGPLGMVDARVARVSEISLSKTLIWKNAVIEEAGQVNRLGLALLSRCMVTMDFINSKLYIKAGKGMGRPFAWDMAGLHLRSKKGKLLVYAVDKNSPAFLAGLSEGDEILKLNGVAVAKATRFDVKALLQSGDGKTIKVILQRDGKARSTVMTLRKTKLPAAPATLATPTPATPTPAKTPKKI